MRLYSHLKYLKLIKVKKQAKRKNKTERFSVDNFSFFVSYQKILPNYLTGKNFVFKFLSPNGLRPSRSPSGFATPFGLAK